MGLGLSALLWNLKLSMSLILGVILPLASGAAAAGSEEAHIGRQEVASHIAVATGEVLLAVPTLRSHSIAEALREAMVVRGVEVYLLVSPELAQERASFVTGLKLAGAQVRLARVDGDASYLVLDRRRVIAGRGLAALDASPEGSLALSAHPASVEQIVAWFYQDFVAARTYQPALLEPKLRE